jgi:hypothetical protein
MEQSFHPPLAAAERAALRGHSAHSVESLKALEKIPRSWSSLRSVMRSARDAEIPQKNRTLWGVRFF